MIGAGPRPLALGLALVFGLLATGCGQYPDVERPRGQRELIVAELVASLEAVPRLPGDGLTSGATRGFDAGDGGSGSSPGDDDDRTRDPHVIKVDGRLVLVRGDGPLFTCPVYGRGYYTASFGDYRAGPPEHPHQGNDVFAPYGTPIVAPFDGFAVATPNTLGGRAVRVYGAEGYAYNAHLSGYGNLGPVELGEVIGYVGSSGNASRSAPHDHFEWHPGGGPAVDPFPFLIEACPVDRGSS